MKEEKSDEERKTLLGGCRLGEPHPCLENLTIVQLKHHPEPLKSLKRKSLFDWYSSSSSVAVIKHCVKKQPGGGKSSLAHNQVPFCHFREVKAGIQAASHIPSAVTE